MRHPAQLRPRFAAVECEKSFLKDRVCWLDFDCGAGAPGSGQHRGQFTNWDEGLFDARSLFPNRSNPDLLVLSSDGNPNRRGGHTALGHSASVQSVTEAQAMDWAIDEADQAKTDGIRILAIGIGGAINVANLEDISSPDACYVRAANYGQEVEVRNLDNGRSVTCIAKVTPLGGDADIVLHADAFVRLADLTDAPVPVEISW